MAEIEKLDLKSMDIAEDKLQKMKELFPEVFTEGDKIDFEKLRLTLGENVDAEDERFGLHWAGKKRCFKIIQEPSIGTLKPAKEESVNWDTTKNLFIEGDNLEVLKQLQKSYYGKVKMIYIDPPYNTGKEFIYPDNYKENIETYLAYSGQTDVEGYKFSTNTETEGRFHSKWLSMMYPRIFLARNLLKEDGVIFISINDNELHNLKLLSNEIFGEENWIGTIIWKNATDNNPTQVAVEHEYVLVYAKNKTAIESVWKSGVTASKSVLIEKGEELVSEYKDIDELKKTYSIWFKENKQFLGRLDRYKYIDFGGVYTGSQSVHNPGKEGYRYDVIHPATKKPCKQPLMGYRFPEDTMEKLLADGKILFGEDESKIIELKVYAKDYKEKLSSLIELDGRLGSYDIRGLFPNSKRIFDNPKPVKFLQSFIPYVIKENDIIVDFFAGSSSTAHAILDLSKNTAKTFQFIQVQLPQPTSEKSDARKNGYLNIAEVAKERIRRVISSLEVEKDNITNQIDSINKERDKHISDKEKSPQLFKGQKSKKEISFDNQIQELQQKKDKIEKVDLGFKVFKLDKSNFKIWDGSTDNDIAQQIELAIDHINPDSSEDDILYEILLKSGFELTVPISELELAGKKVFSIAEDALLICLEKELNEEVIRAIADKQPARVVCLDAGFKNNDQLKTNAVQIMKSHEVHDFRTV